MAKLKLKRDGFESDHQDWAKLARCYGWDYQTAKTALEKHGEYKGYILETPEPELMNVSIPCQKLRDFLNLPNEIRDTTMRTDFKYDEEGLQNVWIFLGEQDDYNINCEVNNRISSAEVATDANGHDHYADDSELTIEINKVININGEVLVLDKDTEELLLSKIEL